MARGVTLATLRNLLKVELGDALETNTATDARYNLLLANKQRDLADMYDWSFLKRQWDLSANGGDRYLTIPQVDIRGTAAEPNFERPMQVDCYYNTFYHRMEYRIRLEDYNWMNSDLDERQDPVMRWMVATNIGEATNADQIEIWPIPVTLQTIRFVGQRKVRVLTGENDKCDIDSLLIVYGVASEQLGLKGQANAALCLRKFNERLLRIRAGMPSDEEPVVFGYVDRDDRWRRPIAIAGGRPTSTYSGTLALGNGVDSGAVIFPTSLPYTPTVINITITAPPGSLNLFGTVVAGTLTATGFQFTLSGMTDSTSYVLNYIVTP